MSQRNHPSPRPLRRAGSTILALGMIVGLLTACDSSPIVAQGAVTSPSGARLAGVDVVIYADDAPDVVASTTTDIAGQWTLRSSSIASGTYRLRVADRWWSAATSWAGATPVHLDAADPATLDVVIDPATRLTGSVVHADLSPVTDWFATVTDTDGVIHATSVVDASGAFRLPLASGAGTYRLWLRDPATATSIAVGGATPAAFELADGQDLRVGPIDAATGLPVDPGTVASAVTGPYGVTTTSVPAGNGFGGGTIYAPTSTAHAPYGAVVVTPGFLMTQDSMSWYGPRIASQGFVVLTINTNNTADLPQSRAIQMLAALDWLTGTSPMADRIDPDRTAVMGWSMGGGGSLNAGLKRPSLRAIVALAPWDTRTDYSAMQVPTLVVACQTDSIAPVAQHAGPIYDSLGATLPREYIEIAGAEHGCVTSNNTIAAQRTVIARQTLGFLQRYVNDDER
ncbi:MAG TPA: carboxypeptidase-like regulatory domain-containing protein, partial [Acidimicrobiales bacterium]|nr:carboxypeptidase-like regulatory domain-containing protein [Acidimicrobiales bacterium]